MNPKLLQELAVELGVPPDMLVGKSRVVYPEAKTLIVVQPDLSGRQHLLTPQAATAWALMRDAACSEDIEIFIVSAYRSVERQANTTRAGRLI
jgi:D-alanyl-D-alanine carboxypeptidase